MNRLLVIANLYHASPRIPGLTGYLTDYGWEVTVVTPPLGSGGSEELGWPQRFVERARIVEAPYPGDVLEFWRRLFVRLGFRRDRSFTEQVKASIGSTSRVSLVDRMLYAYQTFFAFPDTERTWFAPALTAARSELGGGRFDALLSSSPFPTSHCVARRLAVEFRCPWIADYRDPWCGNQHYPFPWFRRLVERPYERRTIRPAGALVAAAEAYADVLRQIHGRDAFVIHNGFDEAYLSGTRPPVSDDFTITYTGTVYVDKQDPEKILRALHRLREQGRIDPKHVRLRFFGTPMAWLDALIQRHGVQDMARQMGRISRHEARRRQQESQLLLLFNWEDEKGRGWRPLKLYEYLGAMRPILATGGVPENDTERILAETRAGVAARMDRDIEVALLRAYRTYLERRSLPYEGDREAVLEYSYAAGARELAGVLDGVARGETVRGGAGAPVAASG